MVLTATKTQFSAAQGKLFLWTRKEQGRGFSLVELMIAMVVLAVGLLAATGLICAAMASNVAPKLSTASATLAESTLERIIAIPADATGAAALTSITDCTGNNFAINTLPGGSATTTATSGIMVDFQQPALPGYSMQYSNCTAGQTMTYDVRWTIEPGPTPSTQLVTVSARVMPGTAGPQAVYSPPITLRTLRGGS